MTRLKVALLLSSIVFLAGCGVADETRNAVRSVAAIVFDPLVAVQSRAARTEKVPAARTVPRACAGIAAAAKRPPAPSPAGESRIDSLPEQKFLKASLAPAPARRRVVRVLCSSRTIVLTRSSST